MKKALLTLAAVAMAGSAFAQGTINFYNAGLTGPNGSYIAGIFRDDGTAAASTIGAGAGFTVGLFGADLTTPIITTTFRTTSAQQVFAQALPDVVIPGAAPNTSTTLTIRAWSTSAGSFAGAQATPGAQWGTQTFATGPLGGPNPNPTLPAFTSPDLGPNFTGFEMTTTPNVPEPTTVAFGILGVGALVLARRRK